MVPVENVVDVVPLSIIVGFPEMEFPTETKPLIVVAPLAMIKPKILRFSEISISSMIAMILSMI